MFLNLLCFDNMHFILKKKFISKDPKTNLSQFSQTWKYSSVIDVSTIKGFLGDDKQQQEASEILRSLKRIKCNQTLSLPQR